MNVCRGICWQYVAAGAPAAGRYRRGQKRCTKCDIYIEWEGVKCPCCHNTLRTGPRCSEYKKKFRTYRHY